MFFASAVWERVEQAGKADRNDLGFVDDRYNGLGVPKRIKICTTVYREIEENSIILMHDEYPTSVRAALSIVDKLLEDGYEFVTVDQIVMD